MKRRVIVVGSGPAGIFAARWAAFNGADVLLLEKNSDTGRKLLITGGGRCNLTHQARGKEFLKSIHPAAELFRPAFSFLSNIALLQYLSSLGIETEAEDGGKIFPTCQSARVVRDSICADMKSRGVTVRCRCEVRGLVIGERGIEGVSIAQGDKTIIEYADRVILATGGLSWQGTGSTGDGHRMARQTGHIVTSCRAALAPLLVKGCDSLVGIGMKNCTLSVWDTQRKVICRQGDLMFSHEGISGPVALLVSGAVSSLHSTGVANRLTIDFLPSENEKELDLRLQKMLADHPRRQIHSILSVFAPARLIAYILQRNLINGQTTGAKITALDRKAIRITLKECSFENVAVASLEKATVTAGGVSFESIDIATMESKIVPRLYFAGEMVDLDGDTGGFNLQIAFSTGALAGYQAATKDSQ